MSIYILCAVVLIAAVPLTWFIKREGEQSWERHLIEANRAEIDASLRRIASQMVSVRIVIADQMTPGLKRLARETNRLIAELSKDAAS